VLKAALASASGTGWATAAPAEAEVPAVRAMVGDVKAGSAVVWAQVGGPTDRVDLEVEVGGRVQRFSSSSARPGPGATWQWRVPLPSDALASARVVAGHGDAQVRFRTAPSVDRPVRIGWSGDIVGQGFGIDEARGGLFAFGPVAEEAFDFFILAGDTVYADQPLPPSLPLPDGTRWRNRVTPAKRTVAQSLDAFCGQYAYNWLDPLYAAAWATTPVVPMWDDHEVLNNWYPGERIDDPRYATDDVTQLADLGWRALRASLPIDAPPHRLDRAIGYGPRLDVFVLDARTFRGSNRLGPDQPMLGRPQVQRLLEGLQASRAQWRVVAVDTPLTLMIGDGPGAMEGFADGTAGPPRFRETELRPLFRAIPPNTVFVTADVHYAAAHVYDQASRFWEFVAGPLHAGQFGPAELDPTFGPRLVYANRQPGDPLNVAPHSGSTSYGAIEVTSDGDMVVTLKDGAGAQLFRRTIHPA
jgi:alkaline phosphatase D